MPLKLLGDRIMVKRDEPAEKSEGGIILTDPGERKAEGVVLSTGSGHRLPSGEFRPCPVKEGDKILFNKFAGTEIDLCKGTSEEDIVIILGSEDIIAVLDE